MKKDAATIAPPRGPVAAVQHAPDWFADALAAPYETLRITVDGAAIDGRAWGERGRPGMVLLHGNAAHLGWWSFLAPFFATDHRVVAFSFSGMGASDWRARYSIDDYAREALAVADAAGAFLAGPPVFIGHSLGGAPALRIASRSPGRMRAAILVDTALPGPELEEVLVEREAIAGTVRRGGRVYPDLSEALRRFRFSPPQPCAHPFIADHLARMGLKQVEGGWTWRFDGQLWGAIELGDGWADLATADIPLAIVRGERSALTGGALDRRMRATAPAGTPFVEIPEAHHHVMVDQPIALVACLRTLLATWA